MKYGIWNIGSFDPAQQSNLCAAGYSPLTASVLCSRGYGEAPLAKEYLCKDASLLDPLGLKDMDKAAERVRKALELGEEIAVYGDYDVDGITATCLLTDFLRSQGGNVTPYIPARIEEGYGLNRTAITALHEQGVKLIITVDCGITAEEEALFCRELGMDLVITDHHECKDTLPQAIAVVDPHRKDDNYAHCQLAGVGVAFKLAAAVSGDQEEVLRRYCDLTCLGTVADVMTLQGENRRIVTAGLEKLTKNPRVGIRALMDECGCADGPVTASLIGYTLAPRINAAGRMEQVEVATELFLTDDPSKAEELAGMLCRMNRQRQGVEVDIYKDVSRQLSHLTRDPELIVLYGEDWHQGVVGIVASRLAEEYNCPTFLICMDGDKGKASSRSYGGFNLFAALESLSPLLESYGGHELAAGFTILRENIDAFREEMLKLIRSFKRSGDYRAALEIDCEARPELLTLKNVDALDQLEPCGAGCPRPVFYMGGVRVDHLSSVGGGKHLRLRLSKHGNSFGSIFFSTTAADIAVSEGDYVEIAFQPQINEFRGSRSVQLNLIDLRPEKEIRQRLDDAQALYTKVKNGEALTAAEQAAIVPPRQEFVTLWKHLDAEAVDGTVEDDPLSLTKKTTKQWDSPDGLVRVRIMLDVFEELGLISLHQHKNVFKITLCDEGRKVNLESSHILASLRNMQAGEEIHV